jgi:hypothetical protein
MINILWIDSKHAWKTTLLINQACFSSILQNRNSYVTQNDSFIATER